jgi:hypothetical protein
LINRAEAICLDQKDFNKEIKNVSYDLTLDEYPQESVTSIMKPSRSNSHSSETIYQGTVIIPHVKDISEKLKQTGNWFNVRTIFKKPV